MKITIYTDPGCPFGFNAQRQEVQLMWHYGDAVQIDRRMIVLSERTATFDELGFPKEAVAASRERLARLYGMPMGLQVTNDLPATIDACRAYVGAKLNAPEQSLVLLRSLRRRAHSDQQRLDDIATLHAAGAEAGIDGASIDAWLTDDDVEAALRADMAATRDPPPEALALSYKLSKSNGGWRYSTSSAVFENDGKVVVAAGFQPFAVYEVAVASVAPAIVRRDAPETVEAALGWAPFPLATAEIAELRGVEIDEARIELQTAGATFTAVANDGYWEA